MRPKQLMGLLEKTIPAHHPILIKGAPGIGKTDCVMQAAESCDADVVLMHPVVSDPTDFKGLPAIVNEKAEFLPFGELQMLIGAKNTTVAFLDDLGQAPAVVQAAAMQLILARRINGHKVSDHVVFVAATNRSKDRAGVTGILEPVKSRFASIVELEANVEDWTGWALTHDVPQELIAFVRFRPELFLKPFEPTKEITNSPSPRTITNLGKLFALGIDDLDTLAGAAGAGFATEFIGFIRVYRDLPDIDAILLNPDKMPVPRETSAMFAVTVALAMKMNADNAGRAIKYFNRLPDEFAALGIRDGLRRCPNAAKNKEFLKWCTDHQDILI